MACDVRERFVFRSPTVRVRDYRCHPRTTACEPEEVSSRNEIVFLRSGMFQKHVGRRGVIADMNHVLFFRRGQPYRVSHPVTCGDSCTVLTLRNELLVEIVARHEPPAVDRPDDPMSFTHAPCDPACYLEHRRLFQRAHQTDADAMAVEEAALRLAERVIAAAYAIRGGAPAGRRDDTVHAHRDLAESVRALLAARFREPMALDELAREVHSSPYHLSRLFREQVGLPIHRYRTRLRLRAAVEPLANGENDLTRLAFDLGFTSHSHFTTAFRREFGLSPGRFRDDVRNGRSAQTSKILKAARNAVA